MSEKGWIVEVDKEQFNKNRKANSLLVLKSVWGNLDALYKGEGLREIELGFAKLSIYRVRGWGFISLPVFPLAFLHENLHFVVSYFTDNESLIMLIPPVLDLFYLPLLLLWFGISTPIHLSQLVYVFPITFWVEWSWMVLLISNIHGDFYTYFRTNRKKPENPQDSKT